MLHQKIKGFDKLVTGGIGWRPFSPNGRSWGQVYGQGGVDAGLASPVKGGWRGGGRRGGPCGLTMQGSMSVAHTQVDLGRREGEGGWRGGWSPSPTKLTRAPLSASPNQKIDNLTKKNEVEYGRWEFGGRRALSVEPWEMAGGGGGPMLPILSGSLERRGGIVEGGGWGGGKQEPKGGRQELKDVSQEPKGVSKLIGVASEVFVYFVWVGGG
jgi:hypothetical protein